MLVGLGRPTRKITFVTNGLVSNLNSYGADVFAMCSGLTTYMAYEVHGECKPRNSNRPGICFPWGMTNAQLLLFHLDIDTK
ncbi:hypothetical protein EK904_002292 [Melospiza melodia maxima]|nr:hypothetical protein EK904_002292 [Melospiza melodia maxima]